MTAAISTQAQLPGDNALVLLPEAHYVTETETGLVFAPDTPLEVWGSLTERLLRQRKVLDWAIADAINFGEDAYGEVYAQWVEETGLTTKTLANIAWVGRRIESSRRREDISFAHHAEVASLPVPEQESLLEAAERQGMTRYDLRDAVRERKRKLEDQSVTEVSLVWVPTRSDLTDEARAVLDGKLAGVGKRHATGYERGFLDALLWAEVRDAFLPGRWP